MPVVDGDMPLVLRTAQTPPASDPGPGALSATQVDANWSMLKAAILVLAAEMLSTSSAEELTGPETPESGDFFILVKGGISYFALVDDLIGGGDMTNPMTAVGDLIIGGTDGAPARLAAGTNGYVLTLVAGVPTWVAASAVESWEPVTISHDGADVAPVTGDTITVTFSSGWTGTIAWLRAGVVIDGATSATYTLVEADVDSLIRPRISSLIFTAAGYTAGAAPGGGALTFVQQKRGVTGFGTEQAATFDDPVTATNGVLLCVKTATAGGAPAVVGSDTVSFGSPLYFYDADGQTHRYYARANCPALTSVTVTPTADGYIDVEAIEVAGGGSSIVLEGTPGGANYGSNTSPWEFAIDPAVAGTFLLGVCDLTDSSTPTGASTVTTVPGTDDATQYVYAEIAASGAQTPQMTLTTPRGGQRSWVLFKAGA